VAAAADKEPPRIHAARTRGRELALQLAYSWEQNHYVDDGALLPDDVAAELDDATRAFAKELFAGLIAERAPVDAAVDERLENWNIGRLAMLDRALLRLGAFELIYRADTPPKVAINEYIELAKRFGSDAKTAKLVNGVLDRIAREHRGGEVGKKLPSGN
jgi:transcription antitermination protein NusB